MNDEELDKWFSELELVEKQVICGLYTTIKNNMKGEEKNDR